MYLSNQYHFCLVLFAPHLMGLILVLASPVSSLPSRTLTLSWQAQANFSTRV
ncbi:hypothetical protein BDW75DRAFT_224027 [Aspergillus navahoensis]